MIKLKNKLKKILKNDRTNLESKINTNISDVQQCENLNHTVVTKCPLKKYNKE